MRLWGQKSIALAQQSPITAVFLAYSNFAYLKQRKPKINYFWKQIVSIFSKVYFFVQKNKYQGPEFGRFSLKRPE